MAPIDILPNELLQEIILWFRPNVYDWAEKQSVYRAAAVCKRWRFVIHRTGALWTCILLGTGTLGRGSNEYGWRQIRLMMERNQGALVDVQIELGKIYEKVSRTLLEEISKSLPFERWRSLYLCGAMPDLSGEGESLNKCGNFENLESLVVLRRDPNPFIDVIQRTAHRLVKLEVGGYADTKSFTSLFDRLSTLRITVFSPMSMPESLPPSITHLEFDKLPKHKLEFLPHITHLTVLTAVPLQLVAPTRFPRLRFLSVPRLIDLDTGRTRTSGGYMFSFPHLHHLMTGGEETQLDRISAPKLQKLHLKSHHNTVILQSPSYELSPKSLELADCTPWICLAWLAATPGLEHLSLAIRTRELSTATAVQNALKETTGDEWKSCPNLISLRVRFAWRQREVEVEPWVPAAKQIVKARTKDPMDSILLEWACGSQTLFRVER